MLYHFWFILSKLALVTLMLGGVYSLDKPKGDFNFLFQSRNVSEDLNRRSVESKLAANSLLPNPISGERLPGISLNLPIDCITSCTVGDIHRVNEESIYYILHEIIQYSFFRYFKIYTDTPCSYWAIQKICVEGGSCGQFEPHANDIPACLKEQDDNPSYNQIITTIEADSDDSLLECNQLSKIKSTLSKIDVDELAKNFSGWDDIDTNMWSASQLDGLNPSAIYVDLRKNPESNTGYTGDEPKMIWRAIYDENCFTIMKNNITNMCHEERLFYRLINGLNTEITVHVFAKWKRDPHTLKFLPNQGLWNRVYGEHPEKLRDLYYTFHFLLNAIHLISPYKDSIKIESSVDEDKNKLLKLVRQLITSTISCNHNTNTNKDPNTDIYNWNNLFTQPETQELKDQLKLMFRNITTIVNCVSCDKCRMWSNLHMLGMGTALKITLAKTIQERKSILGTLQRNEVVALFNTLHSFSEALHFVNTFSILDTNNITKNNTNILQQYIKYISKNIYITCIGISTLFTFIFIYYYKHSSYYTKI